TGRRSSRRRRRSRTSTGRTSTCSGSTCREPVCRPASTRHVCVRRTWTGTARSAARSSGSADDEPADLPSVATPKQKTTDDDGRIATQAVVGRHLAVSFLHGKGDGLVVVEGADRELRVLCEPVARRVPHTGAHGLVVRPEVVVEQQDVRRHVELVRDEPEEDSIGPGAVTPVRAATHAFADEAGALRVR